MQFRIVLSALTKNVFTVVGSLCLVFAWYLDNRESALNRLLNAREQLLEDYNKNAREAELDEFYMYTYWRTLNPSSIHSDTVAYSKIVSVGVKAASFALREMELLIGRDSLNAWIKELENITYLAERNQIDSLLAMKRKLWGTISSNYPEVSEVVLKTQFETSNRKERAHGEHLWLYIIGVVLVSLNKILETMRKEKAESAESKDTAVKAIA